MAKSKALTPQEVYKQRRLREEKEKNAYLPPGLVNHGNTCFMNSVLQGLIATKLLSDLVLFAPISQEIQMNATTPIVSRRSPQLTNGHNLAGPHEKAWVDSMPIGDMFLTVMYKAWDSQAMRRKDVISPKPILSALGQKYDQYLDFAQQDAHEFLRILLDAMRMEEQDIIKKSQPPSSRRRRRRTTITPESLAAQATDESAGPTEPPLLSFADMIFGGELTSILVCQKCKHVSQTYEEFNDISLSIKAEDYLPHNRKRDRFKKIVDRLTQFPGTSKPQLRPPITHAHAVEMLRSSSVPPSPRTERDAAQLLEEHPRAESPRRRSLDLPPAGGSASETDATVPPAPPSTEGDSDRSAEVEPVVQVHPPVEEEGTLSVNEATNEPTNPVDSEVEDKHVEFVEPTDKKERQESAPLVGDKEKDKTQKFDDMSWVKLGRRISLSVGLGRSRGQDKEKDKRERKSRSTDRSNLGVPEPIKEGEVDENIIQNSASMGDIGGTSQADDANGAKNRVVSDSAVALTIPKPDPTPNITPSSSVPVRPIPIRATGSTAPIPPPRSLSPQPTTPPQAQTSSTHAHISFGASILPHHTPRSRSPKAPKPSAAETEYLRKILADVSTSPTLPNPFSMFKPPSLLAQAHHHGAVSQSFSTSSSGVEKEKGHVWLGMGRNFTGIEECLKLFTAVEVLDGENMVGCRHCWKIQNGATSKGKDSDPDDDDEDDESPSPTIGVDKAHSEGTPVESKSDDTGKQVESTQHLSKLLAPTPSVHIPTSISTPSISTYSTVDDRSDTRSVSSLPSEPISTTSESSTLLTGSDSDTSEELAGPGGMPIPKISTTAPDTQTGVTFPEQPNISGGSNEAENTQPEPTTLIDPKVGANSLSRNSLNIPRARPSSLYSDGTTDNDSSDDESDASAESSISRGNPTNGQPSLAGGASTSQGTPTSAAPSPQPKKPSKPKPVVMRPAYKRYLISTPPPVLVIHLKRFQQTSKGPFMSFSSGFKKLDDYVSFPEYLDLLPFLAPRKEDYGLGKKKGLLKERKHKEERCMYRLYAVVVHIGNMLGGHYVAYTALPSEPPPMKPAARGGDSVAPSTDSTSSNTEPAQAPGATERQWAHISDTHVRLTSLEEVLRAKAYICMYERC